MRTLLSLIICALIVSGCNSHHLPSMMLGGAENYRQVTNREVTCHDFSTPSSQDDCRLRKEREREQYLRVVQIMEHEPSLFDYALFIIGTTGGLAGISLGIVAAMGA